MSLQQYAYRVKMQNVKNDFIFKCSEYRNESGVDGLGNDMRFDYWRKFSALDDWMRGVYLDKGGTDNFNLHPVRLTEKDLDNLYVAVQSLDFYKGRYNYNEPQRKKEEEYDHLMKFITKARRAIDEGDAVYYDNWW